MEENGGSGLNHTEPYGSCSYHFPECQLTKIFYYCLVHVLKVETHKLNTRRIFAFVVFEIIAHLSKRQF